MFLDFALSPAAAWKGNFRDLNAALVRMATMAPGGRISTGIVAEEIERREFSWSDPEDSTEQVLRATLTQKQLAELDLFDRAQLTRVLEVCSRSRSLSDAGRALFGASRQKKSSANDADRLRKYLARFGLEFAALQH